MIKLLETLCGHIKSISHNQTCYFQWSDNDIKKSVKRGEYVTIDQRKEMREHAVKEQRGRGGYCSIFSSLTEIVLLSSI